MWQLKLKGVRQHQELELEFPNNGILLLKGRSGSGKTTVLDAIEEALFGTASGLNPWGSSKYHIELSMDNPKKIHITRTAGPKSLTVIDENGNELKDDEAQSAICNAIGMSAIEFQSCSYIKQKASNSLLSLGATDQLYFIESLSNGSVSTEEYKKNINKKLKELNEEIKTCEVQEEALEATIKKNLATVSSIQAEHTKPDVPDDIDKQISAIEQKISDLEKISAAKAKERGVIQSELASDLLDKITSTSSEIEKLQIQQQGLINSLLEPEDRRISLVSKQVSSVDELRQKVANYESHVTYLLNMKEIKELASEVYRKWPTSEGGNLTQYLEARLADNNLNLDTAKQSISDYRGRVKEIQGYDKPQSCPSCSADLIVSSGKITQPDYNQESLNKEIETLNTKIAEQESTVSSISEENAYIRDILSKSLSIKSRLTKNLFPDITDAQVCHNELAKLNEQIDETKKHAILLEDVTKTISSIQSQVASVASALEQKNKTLETMKASAGDKEIDKTKLEKRLAELHDEERKYSEDKSQSINELHTLKHTKSTYDHYLAQDKIIKSLQADIQNMEEQLKKIQSSLVEARHELGATTRLKELSDIAAVQAIEKTIDAINASAEPYIDQMFAEDGTVIRLNNVSTTAKGEERARLSVDAFHKGRPAKRVKDFSGGEQSRASLAFQLGLSDLYKSPILLVDEGFTGLSEEDYESCLEVLRVAASDRLVLVIEHNVPEAFFDKVERIGVSGS